MKTLTPNLHRIHGLAGGLSMLIIVAFLTSSIIAETIGNLETVVAVKRAIVMALPGLVVLLPLTAGLGQKLGGRNSNPLIRAKSRRMRFIASNGLLLVLLALILNHRAANHSLDSWFWLLQSLEYLLGSINLFLMGLMMRDGMILSGRLKSKPTFTQGY